MNTILIAGASGFVGQKLVEKFNNEQHKVIALQRDQIANHEKLVSLMNTCDVLINLSGANIIHRWTQEYKNLMYESRIQTTKSLVNAMQASSKKPKIFISTSAVGIYKNDKVYDEQTQDYADDFLANLCKDWEEEAKRAKEFGVRVLIFRFGIVLGKNGGAFEKMLPPFKFGLGGTIGNGQQSFSFIHIDDLLNAYNFAIEHEDFEGVCNLCAPESTTNLGLTQALGKALKRPTIFPVPEFVLRIIFGEGAKVLTDGQKAMPKKLLDAKFEFQYKNIQKCVNSLI